ncbi:MAG TPA: GDP-L-fucose synthase [Dehalococcoidia bacterium]|nr:GDP-L-fucose synthase [Dehalococcoidia bacterium]
MRRTRVLKKKKKILITGATGMVGHAFRESVTPPAGHEFKFVGSKDCDLTDRSATFKMFSSVRADCVIHLAAMVGGVKGNTDYVGDFYSQNIQMNTNVLDAAHTFCVEKVVSLLSTCIYPDAATYPLTEDQIHAGPPHRSNFGYAYAKRMLDIQSRAYRQQYGHNFVTVVPNNLFGENDNFHLTNGHVIPALIRKVYEAREQHRDSVMLWGDGAPLREFTYSVDIANALLFVLQHYDCAEPLNIGDVHEISIKEVVDIIAEIFEFRGSIWWDPSMPKGQFRKPSSNRRFLELGWNSATYTPLKEALIKTCAWFEKNYPYVRGI